MRWGRKKPPLAGGEVPDPEPWPDEDEPGIDPGAYEITVASTEQARLARPLRHIRDWQMEVAGGSAPYAPGQLLMISGRDASRFEIVKVLRVDRTPDGRPSYAVQRRVLRTLGCPHPVGAPIVVVTAERVPIEDESPY